MRELSPTERDLSDHFLNYLEDVTQLVPFQMHCREVNLLHSECLMTLELNSLFPRECILGLLKSNVSQCFTSSQTMQSSYNPLTPFSPKSLTHRITDMNFHSLYILTLSGHYNITVLFSCLFQIYSCMQIVLLFFISCISKFPSQIIYMLFEEHPLVFPLV